MEMEAAPTVILLISVICKEEEAATKEEVSCFAVVTADVAAGFRLYYFLSIPFFDSLINNRNIIRGRSNALLEMDQLEPSVFKRMFRVDRATFGEIMERITPFIQAKNLRKACNSSGAPILLKTRLAVTLRWLAGASYLDLCFAFGISSSTFYHSDGILWPIMEALDAAFSIGFPFHDLDQIENLSQGFFQHSGGLLDGCVLALDGLGVATRQPSKWEVKYPKDYRFRKGGFAIIVLAGCDVQARFIAASATHSGSTNDIIAWQDTKLYEALEIDKLLPPKYFFIGDEAFTNTNQLLTPWSGRGLDQYKDSFNFWLSHSRQCVERSFGILTQRWGIFWRPFRFAFDRWSLVVLVSMKLHNLCIDRNDKTPSQRFNADVRSNDEWVVYDNYRDDDAPLRGRPLGDRRRDITFKLQQLGVLRPLHASMNSRCD